MDDEAAVRSHRVASAAAAWMRAPGDVTAYAHLVEAVEDWESYTNPQLPGSEDELTDVAYDANPPQPLQVGIDQLKQRMHSKLREQL